MMMLGAGVLLDKKDNVVGLLALVVAHFSNGAGEDIMVSFGFRGCGLLCFQKLCFYYTLLALLSIGKSIGNGRKGVKDRWVQDGDLTNAQ